jgi:hypothetical protein
VKPEVVGSAFTVALEAVPVDDTTVTSTNGAVVKRLAVKVTAPVPVIATEPCSIEYGRLAKFSFIVEARMSVPAVKTFFEVIRTLSRLQV